MPKVRAKHNAPPRAVPPTKQQRGGRASKRIAAKVDGQAGLSALDILPDELLLNVLGFLSMPHDLMHMGERRYILYTLRSLSLTNRHFNALVADLLYGIVDSSFEFHPHKLVQTLVANADLARRVKNLRWRVELSCHDGAAPYKPTTKDMRLLQHNLKQLDVPDRASLLKAYSTGRFAELLRVAMLHTPNLQELHLGYDSGLRRHNPYQTSCVPLHTLSLRVSGMKFREYSSVFRLPAIKKLTLLNIEDPEPFGLDITGSVPEPSAVTHLSLLDSFVNSANLILLIRCFRELQSLTFSFGRGHSFVALSDTEESARFVWPEVRAALLHHKNTLTSIDFDDRAEEEDSTRDPLPIGSFKEFTKLVCLGVPYEILFAKGDVGTKLADLVPDSLHRLNLTVFEEEEDTQACYRSIVDLLHSVTSPLPNLHHINVRAHRFDHLGHLPFRDLWEENLCLPSNMRITIERNDEHYDDRHRDRSEFDSESDYDEYESYSDWNNPIYNDLVENGFLDDDEMYDEMDDEMMDQVFESMGTFRHHLIDPTVNPFPSAPVPSRIPHNVFSSGFYPVDLEADSDDLEDSDDY